jgi:hypothetical protein
MRIRAVGNLIALARSQSEAVAIGQCGFDFTLETQNHVPLGTPMIGRVSSRIFHHPNPNLADVLGSPERHTSFAGMLRRSHLCPIRNRQRKSGHLHKIEYSQNSHLGTRRPAERSSATRRSEIRCTARLPPCPASFILTVCLKLADSIRSRDFRCRNVHFNPTGASARRSTGSGLA